MKNKYSYDAWGRPRNADTWVLKPINTASALTNLNDMQPMFDRGYTGHEIMAGFELINMNGRLYDPYLQRFLSPDNVVQEAANAQNYNRYSYCLNNPLRYTDPTGWRQIPYLIPNYEWTSGGGIVRYPSFGGGSPYTYNWTTGNYENSIGSTVSFSEVYTNYVLPNAAKDVVAYTLKTEYSLSRSFYITQIGDGNIKFNSYDALVVKGTKVYLNGGGSNGGQGGGWLDNIQTGLDIGGIADPTGIVDGVNALIYAGRGQWGNAGISALAIIPYIGDIGKASRLSAKTLQLTSRARTAENGLELAEKFLKPNYTEIAPGVFRSSDQLRQFRMTISDITGVHGSGPHFNFEIFSPLNLNKAATNYHVPIINP